MFGVLGMYNFFCRILIWEQCPHLLLVKLLWMNTIQNQTSLTLMVLELMGEIMEGVIEKEVNVIFIFIFHDNFIVKFYDILKVAFIFSRTKKNVKKMFIIYYDLNDEIYFRTWKGKRW